MADNVLSKTTEYFAAPNSRVGKTINDHLQALKELGFPSNLETASKQTVSVSFPALANNDVWAFGLVVPYKAQIQAIWVSRAGAATNNPVLEVDNSGKDPFDAPPVALDAIATAGEPESQILSSTVANLVVEAEGNLKITVTAGATDALAGGGNIVFHLEPVA